jgi:hypothetical protein
MIITSNFDFKNLDLKFLNRVVFDSYILMVFIVGCYVENNIGKKNIIRKEDKKLLKCLNLLLKNLRIKTIRITPTIFSEFVNQLRKFYKSEYKNIKKECLKDLKKIDEIYFF